MDLHRRRSVLVRMTETGQQLETVRVSNAPEYLRQVMANAKRFGTRQAVPRWRPSRVLVRR
jgi:hypothetical protein